ncbi:CARDB domain-containing protein [Halorubrum sp. GN11_10-6_MGM]|uniref:CARDB domain-containing protein n=1 Tax=Halorubrum sp. GN11_10-6_MGM TaxID=2518112 RepID=UPI00130EF3CB|nr:CARDB domain-containing protein [Halorubrum sp. GN11_10-6_MGM]
MRRQQLLSTLLTALVVASVMVGVTTVVSAQQSAVSVSIDSSPDEPVVGETVTFNVTVTNQEGSSGVVDVSSIMLRTNSEHYERIEDVGSLAPGGSLTVQMTTSFEQAGQRTLKAHVSAERASGRNLRAYYSPVTVDVQELDINGGLSTTANGSDETTVTLTNYGNVELSDVEILAATDGRIRDRRDAFDVGPDEADSITFDTDEYATDTVTFTAEYTARGERYETTRTSAIDREVIGEIRLTSVEVTRGGSMLSIDGEAANIGGTDAESVLISIPNADGVSPAGGSGEYFVGSVDASEFATFQLSASVEGDTVPVEIAYIADNDRVTTTQVIDVSSLNTTTGAPDQSQAAATSSGGRQGQSGVPVIPIVVGVIVIVGLGGIGRYLWNRE